MYSIVPLLIELLRIESITGNEANLCGYIEKLLCEKGLFDQSRASLARHENNLIIKWTADDALGTLGLFGHLDTVPYGGGSFPEPRIEDDRIFGLGASDMKSGLAVMLEVLSPNVLENVKYNLCVVFYSGEEGYYEKNGLKSLMENKELDIDCDFAIVLEPTDNDLHVGCLGGYNAGLKVSGKRCHSARPWLGDNAIYKAMDIISKVREVGVKEVVIDGLSYHESMSVTTIHGGTANNVIPDEVLFNINCRFSGASSQEEVQKQLDDIMGDKAQIVSFDIFPAARPCMDNSVFKRFRYCVGGEVKPKGAYTDLGLLFQHGIEGVNYGPGDPTLSHREDENVEIPKLLECCDKLIGFLCDE